VIRRRELDGDRLSVAAAPLALNAHQRVADLKHQVTAPVLRQRGKYRQAELCRLGRDGQLRDVALVVGVSLDRHKHMFAPASDVTCCRQPLGCVELGVGLVVEVEDEVVGGGVADFEVEGGVAF
jgi:hypothetical protein